MTRPCLARFLVTQGAAGDLAAPLALIALIACGAVGRADDPAHPPASPERIAAEHLPNPIRIHPRVISGGLPEGEAAFAELRALGIKTIISVDGARPDVERARRYGLRYVHLPHGYDGVPPERGQQLAKAVLELEGPVYIHCHHGKHRSPAAAAVACIDAGLLPASLGPSILKLAGTGTNYRGLFRSVDAARPVPREQLDALPADFPEVAATPPMAEAMVTIEHIFDRLKQLSAADWRTPPGQPGLEALHEALLIREQFTELQRLAEFADRPTEFQELTRQSEAAGLALEAALEAWRDSGRKSPAPAAVQAAFQALGAGCAACHQKFRDVPGDLPSGN